MRIPKEVRQIIEKLNEAKFEAYIVGGCVRDLLMDREPQDWDVTTNATPEQIQNIFPDSFYENSFGTVGVKTDSVDQTLVIVEVTTYRTESEYSNKRHPDRVEFAKTLDDDLMRRDFTMNAVAMKLKVESEKLKNEEEYEIIDPYNGKQDIQNKTIKAVGEPNERISEDALRMMRAVRFVSTIGFTIESETLKAIESNAKNLEHVSSERIRDELCKLIMGNEADKAIELLRETGLMKCIIPELLEGWQVGQNLHHIYTVWEHNVRALRYTCEKNYSLEVRLAALLHDVGKPRSKRGEGYHSTFYGHEVIGAKMTEKILSRLKFSNEQIEKITKLVRYHLFYYNPGEVTESSVRRLVANIGKENVEDLLKVREADRIGSGTPKAIPYKLRHLKFMIDKVARDPISPKLLKINGNDVMNILAIEPGPKVGMIMNALMEEVLEEPSRNSSEYLAARSKELGELPEEELKQLAAKGKEKVAQQEEQAIGEIKHKHYVS